MTTDAAPPIRLAHLGILRFTGADALSFLQGQLSNDTQRLAEGRPLLAAYSSAQGRVLAVIYLLPHSSGIAAILPRETLAPTLERLRKFVLRAKVRIEDAGESLLVAGRFGAAAHDARGGYVERGGVGVAPVHGDAGRSLVIGAADGIAPADDAQLVQFEREWRLADVRAGLPQIYAATSEAFVAQMLNLDLLDGISFSKGCYTGQEIIARTQHLGRIKRRLHRLLLPPGTWRIGQSLHLHDGRHGRLTEVIESGGRIEGLAVLNIGPDPAAAGETAARETAARETAPGETASEAAVEASELPLPYPLFGPHVRE
ncbi:MAG TPA: hypothetical protein VHW71_09750 [Steroidobacteraceae bacterium]|nr:hypothetical protein [Steroidobacteraceae bacterium]